MGRHLEHFWWSWERYLGKRRKSKIERQYNVFAIFWGLGGSGWRLLGSILGDLGHKLGSLGRSWRQVGNFLATCWEQDGQRWLKMANFSEKSDWRMVDTRGTRAAVATWARAADPLEPFRRVRKLEFDRIRHQVYTRPTTASRGRRISSALRATSRQRAKTCGWNWKLKSEIEEGNQTSKVKSISKFA